MGDRRMPRSGPTVVGYAKRGPFEFEITMELDGREVTCSARAPWDARRACQQQLELGRAARPPDEPDRSDLGHTRPDPG
jgi:hypothetical protein